MKLEDKNEKIRRQKCTIAKLAQYKILKKMFQGFKFTFMETFYVFFSYLLYSSGMSWNNFSHKNQNQKLYMLCWLFTQEHSSFCLKQAVLALNLVVTT